MTSLMQTDPKKAMTQCEKVLDYMRRHGSIDQREALNHLGIMRLASRINDLKKQGYRIGKFTKTVTAKDGTKHHVAEYFLESEC